MFSIQKGQPKDYFTLQLMLCKCIGVDLKGNTTNLAYKVYSKLMLLIIFGYPFFQGCDVFRFFHEPRIFSVVFLHTTVFLTSKYENNTR